MPTYGLPCPTPDPAEIGTLVSAIETYLTCIQQALVSPLTYLTSTNYDIVSGIQQQLQGPVDAALQTASGGINSVLSAILSDLDEIASSNDQTLGYLLAQAGVQPPISTLTPAQATALATAQASVPQIPAQSQPVASPTIVPVPVVVPGPTGRVLVKAEVEEDEEEQPPQKLSPPPKPALKIAATTDTVCGVNVPQLPRFPCPPIADEIKQCNIIGTPAWCACHKDLLTWLSDLGEQLLGWTVNTLNSLSLTQVIEQWRSKLGEAAGNAAAQMPVGGNLVVSIYKAIDTLLCTLEEMIAIGGNGVAAVIDMLTCAHRISIALMPVDNESAYVACLILRNALKWVQQTRLGSPTYTGVNASTYLLLPQLERYLDMLLLTLCPVELPGVGEVLGAWRTNYIDDDTRDCMLRLHGLHPTMMQPYILAGGSRIGVQEMIQLVRRQGGGPAAQRAALRAVGVLEDELADQYVTLYERLPEVRELLDRSRHNLLDDQYVSRYGLADGFDAWYTQTVATQLTAMGYTQDRARYEYMRQWQLPGIGEMRELLWRLRAGKQGITTPFVQHDYLDLLRGHGVPEIAVQWYQQTAYRVISTGEARALHQMLLYTDAQLQSSYQDIGYSDKDATTLTQIDVIQTRRRRAAESRGWTPARLAKAYSVGIINQQVVSQQMQYLGYTTPEAGALMTGAQADLQYRVQVRALSRVQTQTVTQVRTAVNTGVMDETQAAQALTTLGWRPAQATGLAHLAIAARNTRMVSQSIARLRSAYLAGDVDAAYCQRALSTAGVVPDATAQYLAAWQLALTPRVKRRSAGQIVTDLAEGVVTTERATARWINLGYSADDIQLLLADAQRKIVTVDRSAIAALQLPPGKASGTVVRLIGDAAQLSKRLVDQLKSMEPATKLGTWVKAGIITQQQMTDRLRLYGYTQDAIDRWEAEYVPPVTPVTTVTPTTPHGTDTATATGSSTVGV